MEAEMIQLADASNHDFSSLENRVDLIYCDPPFNTGRNFGAYKDSQGTTTQYVDFLAPIITNLYSTLKNTGSILIHLDWRTSHYVKVAVDKIFGEPQFQREIVWCYNSGGASQKSLSNKHDVILWWSKTQDYTFNPQREPYATPNVEGREGFHPDGRLLTDVWNISIISTTGKERVGYPTQKPLSLLRRCVELFSNPNDLILDPFCGSGTTGVAAKELGRQYVLLDKNLEAINTTRSRL